jgi:hypothetical protein
MSKRVFGGVPFVESDEYDEVPCMRLKGEVLGLQVILFGHGGNDGYELTISSELEDESAGDPELDISLYVGQLVERILDVRVKILEA